MKQKLIYTDRGPGYRILRAPEVTSYGVTGLSPEWQISWIVSRS